MSHCGKNQEDVVILFMKLHLVRQRNFQFGLGRLIMTSWAFQSCFLMERVDFMIKVESENICSTELQSKNFEQRQ